MNNNAAPPIVRGSMTPRPWLGFVRALRSRSRGAAPATAPLPWQRAAGRRRAALLLSIGCSTVGAGASFIGSDPTVLDGPLGLVHLVLLSLMFGWVSAGFFTAVMGFAALVLGDRHQPNVERKPISAEARTAIIMPVCNEDASTVLAGLRATCTSLAATGAGRLFDVYLLSDTTDPELRCAEMQAWQTLRDTLGGQSRVFYRWRRRRSKRKAGNVADFCRRWGRNYRYMVVLDADSTMTGDAIVSLVRQMEENPRAGIIQTLPRACGHHSLHARAQQFHGRVVGRLFAAGLAYWQLGESHYWGHNAIIRVEPFMRHCAIAPLPGRGALSGEIMSHDFVEAALMRRAGYEVWMVDTGGSHEQAPPHLIDELQRDRRWCHGNLQNARLMAEPGFAPVHRAMLFTGAMAYVASPLWLVFIAVGTLRWAGSTHVQTLPSAAPVLWGLMLAMLLLPRLLGLAFVLLRREQASYGGVAALVKGALLEAGLATLQAPVRMLAHTLCVVGALTGLRMDWKSPSRHAVGVAWRDAMRRLGPAGAVVALGLVALGAMSGTPTLTLAPVALPLLLAVPLAVLTSRVAPGVWLRERGVLVIPEERVLARPTRAVSQRSPLPRWLVRTMVTGALAGLPIATLPTVDKPEVAFFYLATAVPSPFEPVRGIDTHASPLPDLDRPKPAIVKRRSLKRTPSSV